MEYLITISQADESESLEVGEMGEDAKSAVSWIMRDITKQSVLKQTVIGAASGGLAGYLFGRVGRLAAVGVGVSLLLIQVGQHKGYIRVNWSNVEKGINKAKKSLRGATNNSQISGTTKEVADFVRSNVFLAAGFGSGFLIGLSV